MYSSRSVATVFILGFLLSVVLAVAALQNTSQTRLERPLPANCRYQQVQCIKAPCDPVLICSGDTLTPTPSPYLTPAPQVSNVTRSPYVNTYWGVSFTFPSNKYVVQETVEQSGTEQTSLTADVQTLALNKCLSNSRPETGVCAYTDGQGSLLTITVKLNRTQTPLDVIAGNNMGEHASVVPVVVGGKSGFLAHDPVGLGDGYWAFYYADPRSGRYVDFLSLTDLTKNPEAVTLIKSFTFSGPPGGAVISPTPTPKTTSGCQVGGCSGQLCVEAGTDTVSTCEYRADYACYKSAKCERQATGRCGWTQTPELKSCLAAPPPLQ